MAARGDGQPESGLGSSVVGQSGLRAIPGLKIETWGTQS